MKIQFEPITPNLGAYVKVAAEDVLKEGIPEKIYDALNEYGVLVFPQINIADEQLSALTSKLGTPGKLYNTAEETELTRLGIYRIALDKNNLKQLEYVIANDYWHMDGTSYNIPGKATILKCQEAPKSGGDTGFAHLYAAYEAMPEQQKQKIANLRVIHCMEAAGRKLIAEPSADDLKRWNDAFPPTEQPLVWKQKSGRTSLIIGSTALEIAGMPREEGQALLQELLDWCTQDQFTYRHKWQKGDLVIFNNPGLLHRSHPYNEESGRVMHRMTLEGTEAIS